MANGRHLVPSVFWRLGIWCLLSGDTSGLLLVPSPGAIRTTRTRSLSSTAERRHCVALTKPTTPASQLILTSTIRTDIPVDQSLRKKRLAAGMAFLTGWSDVVMFRRYQSFATMMSGNSLWLVHAAMQQQYRLASFYSCVIASYILGLVAFRRMDLTLRKQCVRVCGVIVMALFVGSDMIHSFTKTRWLPVSLLAAAYGVINSIGTEVAGTLTFVVTGHMTRMTHVFVDRYSRKRGKNKLTEADRAAVLQNAVVIGGFLVGALLGNVLEAKLWLGKWAFTLLGILYGLLFYWLDMESLGGAWWLRTNGGMCELDDDGEPCILEESIAPLNVTRIVVGNDP